MGQSSSCGPQAEPREKIRRQAERGIDPLATVRAAAHAVRPGRWVKSLLVLVGVVATGTTAPSALFAVAATVGAFALASGGVYVFNDVVNREADAAHPTKARRAVASGELPIRVALGLAAGLAALGLALCSSAASAETVACVAAYLAMNALYSWWFREIPVLDVICIGFGKALRVIAGYTAIGVVVDPSLVLTVFFGGVFLISALRVAEHGDPLPDAHRTRGAARFYSPGRGGAVRDLAATLCLLAFAVAERDRITAVGWGGAVVAMLCLCGAVVVARRSSLRAAEELRSVGTRNGAVSVYGGAVGASLAFAWLISLGASS